MTILHPKVVLLLVVGFALVILLMLVAGKRGMDALNELERGSSGLLDQERASVETLTHAQELEIAFDKIYYSVPGAPREVDAALLLEQLDALEREVELASANGVAASDRVRWEVFAQAARDFAKAVRASVASPSDLSRRAAVTEAHERVAVSVGQLVRETARRIEIIASLDHAAFSNALEQHVRLLAVVVLLALAVAGGTVFLVQRLVSRLEWQRHELARLSSDMLNTQEATLRQVAHDLHDQFGQALTAIEANLTALDTATAAENRHVRNRVEDCVGLVQDLMLQARTMSQLLRPSILDDFGLSASLEWLAEGFSQRTSIPVTYSSSFDGRLGDGTETHLFRIAQEALTNVARHADATHIEIRLDVTDREVMLMVSDNGRGIRTPPGATRGIGLAGMGTRAAQIGGRLTVETPPGGGTRVVVRVPLPQGTTAHETQDPVAAG